MIYRSPHYIMALILSMSIFWVFASCADTWQYRSAISFMRTRNLEENIAALNFIWADLVADKRGDMAGAVQIVPIFQRSQQGRGNAGYFLLNCQPTILVAGDMVFGDDDNPENIALKATRNVRAEWLKLPADFKGFFGVVPCQRQVGAVITYNQDIADAVGFAWLDRVWFVLSAPIVSISNSLNPYQYGVQNGTTGSYDIPGNLLQAFNNPWYEAGRIDSCVHHKTTLAEVNVGFGTEWAHEHGFLLWYQTTLDIPSGGKAKTDVLFSPSVGTNGHVGWSNTFACGLPLHPEGSCLTARLICSIANHYYFPHTQRRIFDLHNKPWSRYMLYVNRYDSTLIVPGLNILTQCVRVHPHNYVNLNASVRLGYAGWEWEIGYQLWAHSAEQIQFLTPSCNTVQPVMEDFGIWYQTDDLDLQGKTASQSTINRLQDEPDPEFVHLFQNDINRNSGAAQNARSQAATIAVGYRGCFGYAAFGTFIERPKVNTSLSQWGLWGAVALEF